MRARGVPHVKEERVSEIQVKYPELQVKLSSGVDGNVFAVIATVSRAICAAHGHAAAKEFSDAAFLAESYDEVLQLAMRTVDVV